MNSLQNLASNLIDDFYKEEAMRDNPPETLPWNDRKMSLTAPITTSFMLDAIASRFGKTRVEICKPALELYAEQLFMSLSDSDREAIAKDVDSLVTEHIPDGVTFKSVNSAGSFVNECGEWRGLAALIKDRSEG